MARRQIICVRWGEETNVESERGKNGRRDRREIRRSRNKDRGSLRKRERGRERENAVNRGVGGDKEEREENAEREGEEN